MIKYSPLMSSNVCFNNNNNCFIFSVLVSAEQVGLLKRERERERERERVTFYDCFPT